jgi:hypothetical protein
MHWTAAMFLDLLLLMLPFLEFLLLLPLERLQLLLLYLSSLPQKIFERGPVLPHSPLPHQRRWF